MVGFVVMLNVLFSLQLCVDVKASIINNEVYGFLCYYSSNTIMLAKEVCSCCSYCAVQTRKRIGSPTV